MKNTQHISHCPPQQLGVTLIELMVAMAVSSIIMLGISNIYLSTKKSYVIHDEFSRIQENARYTIETLSSNVRNAGFFGCSSGQGLGQVTNTLLQDEDAAWNFQTGLMGYEAVGSDIDEATAAAPLVITPETNNGVVGDWVTAAGMTSNGNAISVNPDAVIAGLAVKGSDILIIRTTEGTGVRIAKDNGSAVLFANDLGNTACPGDAVGAPSGISGICAGDVLMVSDCSKSRIFQATGITRVGGGPGDCNAGDGCFNIRHAAAGTPGNDLTAWNDQKGADGYGPDSEIIKLVTKTYFIGVNPAPGAGVTPITEPSLYVRIDDGVPQPIVEGIENMQILYGVDTDNDGAPNRYFSANDVPDQDGDTNTVFEGVVSVKISLLARTPQNLPGLTRTAADYAGLTYAMVSPAASINIDPIAAANAAATDRRMRKVFNLNIKIRNKSFNVAN